MNIGLDNYSFNRAETAFSVLTLSGGALVKRHWEAAKKNETGALGHRIVAVVEAVPVLGGIIALIEMVIARYFTSLSIPSSCGINNTISDGLEDYLAMSYMEIAHSFTSPLSPPGPVINNKILGDLWIDNPKHCLNEYATYSDDKDIPIFSEDNDKFHWENQRICIHLDQLSALELKKGKIKVHVTEFSYNSSYANVFDFSKFLNQTKVSLKDSSENLEQLAPASGSQLALKNVRQGLSQSYKELFNTYSSAYQSFNLANQCSSTNQTSSNQLQPSVFATWYGDDEINKRDVKYTFGNGNADVESLEKEENDADPNDIWVHSLVLQTRAPEYFKALLKGKFAESQNRIVICDPSERKIYEQFFLFLYKNEIDEITNEEAWKLYQMGELYGFEDLKIRVNAQAKLQNIQDGHPNNLDSSEQFDADLEKMSSISDMENHYKTRAQRVGQFYSLFLKRHIPQAILHV